jgi:hypothetical protein
MHNAYHIGALNYGWEFESRHGRRAGEVGSTRSQYCQ